MSFDFDGFEDWWYRHRCEDVVNEVQEHLAEVGVSRDIVDGDADDRAAFVASVATRIAMEIVHDYDRCRASG